jgi:hypothetical protein
MAEKQSKKGKVTAMWSLLLGWASCSALDRRTLPSTVISWLAELHLKKPEECYQSNWEGFPAPLGSSLGSVAMATGKVHELARKIACVSRLREEVALLTSEQATAAQHYALKVAKIDRWFVAQQQPNAVESILRWHRTRSQLLHEQFSNLAGACRDAEASEDESYSSSDDEISDEEPKDRNY